jgi:hypothetical protein
MVVLSASIDVERAFEYVEGLVVAFGVRGNAMGRRHATFKQEQRVAVVAGLVLEHER